MLTFAVINGVPYGRATLYYRHPQSVHPGEIAHRFPTPETMQHFNYWLRFDGGVQAKYLQIPDLLRSEIQPDQSLKLGDGTVVWFYCMEPFQFTR